MMLAETQTTLEPGFHYDVPAERYHADRICPVPSLSRGIALELIERSPKHAWCQHPRLGNLAERNPTAAMEFGTLVHTLILGTGQDVAVMDAENWLTKAAKEFRAEARLAGKLPVLHKDYCRAEEVASAACKRLVEMGMPEAFVEGHNEVVAVWREGDAWCRTMYDNLILGDASALVYDLKTTTDASPRAIARKMAQMSYELQDAMYSRGIEALRPDLEGRIRFLFVFVEVQEPFGVSVVELGAQSKAVGLSKYERALSLWQQCTAEKRWPAYSEDIVRVDLPQWAVNAEMEDAGELTWGG